jgi:hypothetical protein
MTAATPFDRRLARLVLVGRTFTADDVTNNGSIAPDPDHTPNGKGSAIGAMFNQWQRRGLIAPTGEVVKSTSPHRKGGAIRVWHGTEAGVLWARNVLAQVSP